MDILHTYSVQQFRSQHTAHVTCEIGMVTIFFESVERQSADADYRRERGGLRRDFKLQGSARVSSRAGMCLLNKVRSDSRSESLVP